MPITKATEFVNPRQGEIWLVDLAILPGNSSQFVPVVVVSGDNVGSVPLRLITPVTSWKLFYKNNFLYVRIEPDIANGISKISAVDIFQLRTIGLNRFNQKLGNLALDKREEIALAIAVLTEVS